MNEDAPVVHVAEISVSPLRTTEMGARARRDCRAQPGARFIAQFPADQIGKETQALSKRSGLHAQSVFDQGSRVDLRGAAKHNARELGRATAEIGAVYAIDDGLGNRRQLDCATEHFEVLIAVELAPGDLHESHCGAFDLARSSLT